MKLSRGVHQERAKDQRIDYATDIQTTIDQHQIMPETQLIKPLGVDLIHPCAQKAHLEDENID
jgi:hypothetical protein